MLIVTASHNYNNQSRRVVTAFAAHMNTVSLFFTSEATVWMLSTEKRTYGPCRFSVSFPNARLFLEQGAEKAEAYWNPCYHHFPPCSCHLD